MVHVAVSLGVEMGLRGGGGAAGSAASALPAPPGSPAFPAQPGLATAKTDGGLVESTPCGGRPPIPHHTGGAQGHA